MKGPAKVTTKSHPVAPPPEVDEPARLEAPSADAAAPSTGSRLRPWWTWIAVAFLVTSIVWVGVVHGQRLAFFCDDSYISYRYSQNFAEGHGLVYNAGGDFGAEATGGRVEGYTNFLWVMLVGVAMKFGAAAEPASLWLGVAFLALTIVATALLTKRLTGSWVFACVPGFLLVSQGPMVLWSVSGLEASCFAATTTFALLAYERALGRERDLDPARGFAVARGLFVAGLLYALSTTVRPDGVVFGAAAGVHLVLSGLVNRGALGWRRVATRAAALAAGFLALFAPFVLWRHSYYGDWLPNTFYVKAGGRVNARLGFDYLANWFGEYWLAGSLAVAGLLVAFVLPRWRAQRRTFAHLALALALFSAYLVWAGGDYMALYRFMVPLLPIAAVASVALLESLHFGATRLCVPSVVAGAVGLVALCAVEVVLVAPTERSLNGRQVSNAIAPASRMRNNSQQWAAVGRQLREWQTSESDAAAWKNVCARLEQTHETNGFTIATTAAGALPFFAQMRTIDQSGLCDRHTAKVESDPWMLDRPGHMKQATTRWIAECRPHLVFWHPQIGDCGSGPHSQPPTADYEPRALDVPELAEEGLCVYCWVRKDLVALLEPLGVVSLKESASLSTKEEGEPATSSDGTNASSTNAAGSNAATSSKGTKHRTGRKPRHVLAKEAFEAELKADLAKLDQEGLPPAPTVDPPPAAPRSGPTFTTTRLHAADPASDEARWSVDDVSRPLAASATADPKTASDEFDVTGAPGSFLEFEVASAPTFETRDVTEEVVDPKDPKGAKTTVTKRKEFTKQLAGVVAPKSVAVALVVGGARHELKPRVSELPFARSRCWHTVHADLAGVPAGKARLEVAVDGKALGKGSGWLATVPRICQEVETPKKRPNVLIVTIDTLRADYLGCYGHDRPTSPNIDAFAAKSVLFEHDVAQAPWTLPSYSSFFSGLYCESHGVVHRDHKLGGSFVTFLEKLAQNGYATGAVVSGTFTDSFWGFDQGFDSYDDLGMVVDESHPDAAATSSGAAVTETEAMKAAAHRRVTSPEVANKAIAWLDAHRDQRFALFVHFFDPHEDYVFHPGVSERFPPRPEPSDFPNAVDARRDVTRLMRARYEGEIAYTDQHVGRVLARLEQLGLADDTVVVLFGDHGEAFNEHNLDPEHPENWKKNLGHGGSLFNEQVHVPLIVRVPGVAPGRVASPTGTIDVGPTLLELCGVDDSGWTHQGESLKPMLEDKSAVRGAPVLTAQYVMQPPADLPPATAAETRVQLSHRLDRGDLCAIEWEPRGRELGARFLFDRAAQWQDYAHDLRTSSDSAVAAKASRDFAQFHDYYEKRRGELEALVRKANVLLLDTVDTALKNLGYTNGK